MPNTYAEVVEEFLAERKKKQAEWSLVRSTALQLLTDSPNRAMEWSQLEKQISEMTSATLQVIASVLIEMIGDELRYDYDSFLYLNHN